MIQFSFLSRSIEKILCNRFKWSLRSMNMTRNIMIITIMNMIISMKSIIITTRSMQIMRVHVRQQRRYIQLNYRKKNIMIIMTTMKSIMKKFITMNITMKRSTIMITIMLTTLKSIMKRQNMMSIMKKFITMNITLKRNTMMNIIMKRPIIKTIIIIILTLNTTIIMTK